MTRAERSDMSKYGTIQTPEQEEYDSDEDLKKGEYFGSIKYDEVDLPGDGESQPLVNAVGPKKKPKKVKSTPLEKFLSAAGLTAKPRLAEKIWLGIRIPLLVILIAMPWVPYWPFYYSGYPETGTDWSHPGDNYAHVLSKI